MVKVLFMPDGHSCLYKNLKKKSKAYIKLSWTEIQNSKYVS